MDTLLSYDSEATPFNRVPITGIIKALGLAPASLPSFHTDRELERLPGLTLGRGEQVARASSRLLPGAWFQGSRKISKSPRIRAVTEASSLALNKPRQAQAEPALGPPSCAHSRAPGLETRVSCPRSVESPRSRETGGQHSLHPSRTVAPVFSTRTKPKGEGRLGSRSLARLALLLEAGRGRGGGGAAAQMCNHIWIQWRPGVSGPHLTEAHPEAQRAEFARSLCSQTFPGILEQSQRGKSQPPGENAQGGCIASGPAYVSPTPAVQGRGQFLATLASPHACHHGVEDKKAFADLQRLQRIQGGQWPWWQHKGMGGKKSLPNLVYQ